MHKRATHSLLVLRILRESLSQCVLMFVNLPSLCWSDPSLEVCDLSLLTSGFTVYQISSSLPDFALLLADACYHGEEWLRKINALQMSGRASRLWNHRRLRSVSLSLQSHVQQHIVTTFLTAMMSAFTRLSFEGSWAEIEQFRLSISCKCSDIQGQGSAQLGTRRSCKKWAFHEASILVEWVHHTYRASPASSWHIFSMQAFLAIQVTWGCFVSRSLMNIACPLQSLEQSITIRTLWRSFQSPVEIPGVSNTEFLRLAANTRRKAKGEPELDPMEFFGFIVPKVSLQSGLPSSSPLNV